MEFSPFYNYSELQSILGAKIKETRLSIGRYTQQEQAKASGVSYSSYKLIEQQGKGSLEDFMKILLSMGKVDSLNMLFAKKEKSVMDNFKEAYGERNTKRIPERQRVRLKKSNC